MKRLSNLIPNSLKPVARQIYLPLFRVRLWWRNKVTDRKTRHELHRYWRSPYDGCNNPESYMEGEVRSHFLVDLVKAYVTIDQEPRILEIGCNVGRNLNYLFHSGFRNLEGIEISESAVKLLRQEYPEMASHAKIYIRPVEEIIGDLQDGSFDIVFTMATLEHIHPESKFIFAEIARITRGLVITIEDELGVSWRHFPRNYKRVFEPLGLRQVREYKNLAPMTDLGSGFVARVFKKPPANEF